MAKVKINARVREQKKLAEGIFDLRLEAPEIVSQAAAGQFVSLYSGDGARLLPRPISICGLDRKEGLLRLVYRIAGAGTKEFSHLKAGERVEVLGPLGNGFPVEPGRKVMLIGGGIGIPPMLELAAAFSQANREAGGEDGLVQSVLGYRDSQMFLKEEFASYGPVYAATEDGSFGTRGNVLDAIREQGISADVICACGPTPMLRALKAYAKEQGIACYLSLEEKMACGIGACLACVCGKGRALPGAQQARLQGRPCICRGRDRAVDKGGTRIYEYGSDDCRRDL